MNLRMDFVQENGAFMLIEMKIKVYFYNHLIKMVMVMTTQTWCMCIDQEMKKKTFFFIDQHLILSMNAMQ